MRANSPFFRFFILAIMIVVAAALACSSKIDDSVSANLRIQQTKASFKLTQNSIKNQTPGDSTQSTKDFVEDTKPPDSPTEEAQTPEPLGPAVEEPSAGTVITNPIDNLSMVFVPEGTFLMGSDSPESEIHEQPMHSVLLDSYWIYQTEVTNAQFAAFVESEGYVTTAEKEGWSFFAYGVMMESIDGAYWQAPGGPVSDILDKLDHPVVHVSWFDALAYCQWAGGTLPTEAQWEKAARGEDGRKYPWGDSSITGDLANYCDEFCAGQWADTIQNDGYSLTAPVGSYPSGASPYGALDMAGNVWEWVADWYSEDYYSVSPNINPLGPAEGESKIHRGGSWFIDAKALQTFSRGQDLPEFSRNYTGFRCIQNFLP